MPPTCHSEGASKFAPHFAEAIRICREAIFRLNLSPSNQWQAPAGAP